MSDKSWFAKAKESLVDFKNKLTRTNVENTSDPQDTHEEDQKSPRVPFTNMTSSFETSSMHYGHHYVVITDSLRQENEKHPDVCSIPFHVHFNQNDSPLTNGTFSSHVPLPYKIADLNGNTLWKTINSQLTKAKESCFQNKEINFIKFFVSVVQTFRPDCQKISNFQILGQPDLKVLLRTTLPFIVDQALSLPHLLQNNIPNLLSNESKTIYLTRQLCCSLLANAFFCTFPNSKIGQMPDLNFFPLYNDRKSQQCEMKKEKIKCLLEYFQTMNKYKNNKAFQDQIVSFERRFISEQVNWLNDTKPLCDVKVEPSKKIEEAHNMLQVDFANKFVGGAVLDHGMVMEEIRFCISPELLVSRLFTQVLNDNEVLVVTGTQIFSRYSGYDTSFTFEGPSNIDFEQDPLDEFGRTFTEVVAMDAFRFKRNEKTVQFQQHLIDRELHKAFVGFHNEKDEATPVATGNWGCGAFNGNRGLKFLIQWMASSHQGRQMVYHTIGSMRQTRYIEDLTSFLRQNNVTVGELYKCVSKFSSNIENQNIEKGALIQHVKQYFANNQQ